MSETIHGITCPACGSHDSIFIGSGGYLTCSWIECPEPALDDAIKESIKRARVEQTELLASIMQTSAMESTYAAQKCAEMLVQLAEAKS